MTCKHEVRKVERGLVHNGWLLVFGDCIHCGDHCVMVVNSSKEIWDGVNDTVNPDDGDFTGDQAEWSW